MESRALDVKTYPPVYVGTPQVIAEKITHRTDLHPITERWVAYSFMHMSRLLPTSCSRVTTPLTGVAIAHNATSSSQTRFMIRAINRHGML